MGFFLLPIVWFAVASVVCMLIVCLGVAFFGGVGTLAEEGSAKLLLGFVFVAGLIGVFVFGDALLTVARTWGIL